jgi:hypothetical protein
MSVRRIHETPRVTQPYTDDQWAEIRELGRRVDDVLRAGMSFNVVMRFPGDQYAAVNPLAVQWDGAGSFVCQFVDNQSEKTRVTIVQRNSDQILVEASLKEGDVVAVEGLQRVREGGTVEVAGAQQEDPEEVAAR